MTIKNYLKYLTSKLTALYSFTEANSIANMLIIKKLQLNKIDLVLNSDNEISENNFQNLLKSELRLLDAEPIQYILGECFFYGLKYFVDKNVLIPRQDTEILVDFIIKKHKNNQNLKILDICSGSGCISISLQKNLPMAMVAAIEISENAIKIMKKNCILNNINGIKIYKYDLLSDENIPFKNNFDIIVCNPPYILEKEKVKMHKNVVCYEPELALFVKDDKPLIFYEKIFDKFVNHLNVKYLYFEINENFTNEIINIGMKKHFNKYEVLQDFNGNDRFVCFE